MTFRLSPDIQLLRDIRASFQIDPNMKVNELTHTHTHTHTHTYEYLVFSTSGVVRYSTGDQQSRPVCENTSFLTAAAAAAAFIILFL